MCVKTLDFIFFYIYFGDVFHPLEASLQYFHPPCLQGRSSIRVLDIELQLAILYANFKTRDLTSLIKQIHGFGETTELCSKIG